jgi:tetratricopeptide (TPR) repeat protein
MQQLGEVLKQLATLVQYIPEGLRLAAIALVLLVIIILAVLQSLKDIGESTRTIVLLIVRYGFGGVGVIFLGSFIWVISTGISSTKELTSVVGRQVASAAASPEKSAIILPPGETQKLAESLIILCRRINPPEGCDAALDALKGGDPNPAIVILRNDVLVRQKDDESKARTLREIALLELFKNPKTALQLYQQSVDLDPNSWQAWSQIGFLLERRGDREGAANAANKALEIGRRMSDPNAMGSAYNVLGMIQHNLGRFENARDLFEKARGQFLTAGSKLEYARVTNNLARAYYAEGEYEPAKRYYEEALSYDTNAKNEQGVAADYLGLAEVLATQEQHERALDYFSKSLAISEKIKDLHRVALALSGMGKVYQNRRSAGDLDKAKGSLLRALQIQQELGNELAVSYQLAALGSLARTRGEYQEAENYYLEAIKRTKTIGNTFAEAVHQRGVGRTYLEWGKFIPALDSFRRALVIDRELNLAQYVARDQIWLGRAFRKLQQNQEACSAWKEAEEFYKTNTDEEYEELDEVRKEIAEARCGS